MSGAKLDEPSYTLEDIKRIFPARKFADGLTYQREGRVLSVDFNVMNKILVGRVKGSVYRPYEVNAFIQRQGTRGQQSLQSSIRGICTCTQRANCKHVVALLLQGLSLFSPATPVISSPETPKNEFGSWLAALDGAATAVAPEAFPDNVRHRLLYQLSVQTLAKFGRCLAIEAMSGQLFKTGEVSPRATPVNASNLMSQRVQPKYLRQSDYFILRTLSASDENTIITIYPLQGDTGNLLLNRVLSTGRAYWETLTGPVLIQGPSIDGELSWRMDPHGTQSLNLTAIDGGQRVLLPITPLRYYDPTNSSCGLVETGLPDALLAALLKAPTVSPVQATWLGQEMAKRFPDRPALQPAVFAAPISRLIEPTPCLRLSQNTTENDEYEDDEDEYFSYYDEYDEDDDEDNDSGGPLLEGWLSFDYGGTVLERSDPCRDFQFMEGADLVVVERRHEVEQAALSRLTDLGFETVFGSDMLANSLDSLATDSLFGKTGVILRFIHQNAPILRAEGWRIEIGSNVPDLMAEPDDWAAEIADGGSGIDWFGVSLGVTVAGEQVDLIPVLLPILRMLPSDGDLSALDSFGVGETTLYAPVGDGRVLPLPMARVRPLLIALYDLFRVGGISDDGTIRMTAARLAELAELEAASTATRLRWIGGSRLLELSRRLREGASIIPIPPPAGLNAQLRPYQQDGLNWLQFLREIGFGGTLADDMGLGKTVQALAHILTEKEAGRLDLPCLVVAPTSLMANWRAEAARFAPSLSVLTLHGIGRKSDFERIADHDLVLTTYPLLARDKAMLLSWEWHLVILDEAQTIKNPKAQTTLAAVQLRTRHRLCMTGTPMENNLEELWSLFHFLGPGLFGDLATFKRVFRTPIEKRGDQDRRRLLARRLRPFLLRRTKQEVASDLPAKTEIIEHIELEGSQRDLYESIRVAMDARVRKELASKGLARSHIAILDALLKLRQVCCDPRLVKLAGAAGVTTSAKLERLMEMLPELIADGRRILLFSQFTSMLALIEIELDRRRIPFVKLTGQTRDRATPVEQFQACEVPVFLISLKAGGTGLNLTAADTVIIYDPWWNPAVERQAMDRAHRIGQDKPVFVYKLATVGTVEDAILTLQARKQALADGLFDPEAEMGGALTADDINLLFQPLT